MELNWNVADNTVICRFSGFIFSLFLFCFSLMLSHEHSHSGICRMRTETMPKSILSRHASGLIAFSLGPIWGLLVESINQAWRCPRWFRRDDWTPYAIEEWYQPNATDSVHFNQSPRIGPKWFATHHHLVSEMLSQSMRVDQPISCMHRDQKIIYRNNECN